MQPPQAQTFTVTFESMGGPAVDSIEGSEGEEITLPDAPDRTGFTFEGWNTNSDGTGTYYDAGSVFTITGDITLYAMWEQIPDINYFTVRFETNGGNTIPNFTVVDGDEVSPPNDPIRAGYTFVGWYRDSTLTIEYNFQTPVTSDFTLYAMWEQNNILITGVSLNKTTTGILVGSMEILTAIITPSNATNQNVTWSSNNTAVATVSTSGVVTALAPGSATITVTTIDGGHAATCIVTVTPMPITSAEIIVTAPVNGATPVTTASGAGNFSVSAVSWSPTDTLFLGSTVYTVNITLTADSNYTFSDSIYVTINGQNATVSNNTGTAITLSYTFPATGSKICTNIAIKTQPVKLIYTHDDQLDLTGLVLTLTYDDTTTEDVAAVDFAAKNIIANPSHGNHLVHATHNGQPVTISYSSLPSLTTNSLTVNKAPGNFGAPSAINTTYTTTLTLASLSLPSGYAWSSPSTAITNAGDGQLFVATYTDPSGNYEPATGNITVNVAKAQGSFVNTGAINTTYTTTLTLASLSLPSGYAWSSPSTAITNAGNAQSFPATYTDPSGNYEPATGNITVNVAKAQGAIVGIPVLNSRTHNSITINAATAPSTGQTVEYAQNTGNTAPSTGWQTSTVFSGLTAGTTYYIFARAAENNNYETGAASSSLVVATVNIANAPIQIYFTGPDDENIVITPVTSTITKSDTLSLIAPTGYAGYMWFVNNVSVGTNSSLTLIASSLALGPHIITLIVYQEEDGITIPYSKTYSFTVTP